MAGRTPLVGPPTSEKNGETKNSLEVHAAMASDLASSVDDELMDVSRDNVEHVTEREQDMEWRK